MFDIPNGRFMNDTKEHILKTAFCLFLQKSFKEVTMKEIVEKTGVSKGAFYHYFPSKESLFTEVLDTFLFRRLVVNYSILNRNSLYEFYHDYVNQFKNVLKEMLSVCDTDVNINYITILFDAMRLFPGFKEKLMRVMQEELDAWKDIIKTSRKKGEFSSPMTDEQIAHIFIYSNDGIGLRLILEGKASNIFDEMLTLWDNFYKEIKD